MKQKEIGLDFLVDKLTRSIENVVTGDSFTTEVSAINSKDLKNTTRKNVGYFIGKQNFKRKKERYL